MQTTGHSYSLENLSGDEEMAGDSSQSSDSTQPSNSTGQSRAQIIRTQLFSAISRARRSNLAGSSSVGSTGNSSGANSGRVITFEMFNQAMQQAFASNPVANESNNAAPSPSLISTLTAPQDPPPTNDMQSQITLMHEMGLRHDAINLQALQITNGDVQAVIELVLSRFGDN